MCIIRSASYAYYQVCFIRFICVLSGLLYIGIIRSASYVYQQVCLVCVLAGGLCCILSGLFITDGPRIYTWNIIVKNKAKIDMISELGANIGSPSAPKPHYQWGLRAENLNHMPWCKQICRAGGSMVKKPKSLTTFLFVVSTLFIYIVQNDLTSSA